MGPKACTKHDYYPFEADEADERDHLWDFFDNICAKRDGAEGSWNAPRMKLKFMKQKPDETVDMFYGRIQDVMHQCKHTEEISKVIEVETLKYGLVYPKVLEKV